MVSPRICNLRREWFLVITLRASQYKLRDRKFPNEGMQAYHTILYHRWRYASIPNHTTDESMRTAMEFEYFLVSPTPQLSLSWFIESSIQVSWTDSGWLGCNLKLFSHTGCWSFILNSCFLLPFCYFAGHSFLLMKKSQILVFFGLTFIF